MELTLMAMQSWGVAVTDEQWLADRFDERRAELRAVAYRMLGSLSDAEDAVQEAWLRLARSPADEIDNLSAWLTTVVSRVCLNMLRARANRRETPLQVHLPDPIIELDVVADPERQAVLSDSVGLALLVVLDTLNPDERLAFVLHDMFAVPFDEIATMLGCSTAAARQHASRARRKVRGQAPAQDADLRQQRAVVDAFFAAARGGDFDALVATLDPDVVLRSDGGVRRANLTGVVRGALAVASQAATYANLSPFVHPAIVNGAPGAVVAPRGKVYSIMAFTVHHGKIITIDSLVDPDRLARLNLTLP